MFSLAITLGLYSYAILLLGILHLLTKQNIILVTIPFVIFVILSVREGSRNIYRFFVSLRMTEKLLFLLIVIQCLVNLIGALGAEIGFDALWYHLMIPKIWLQNHSIFFIPGAQFKYSVMPMLTEMFYFIFPGKLIHFSFGILSLIVTYKISRSMLAVLILSSNLVFGWLSTSAYIDLARTFFEILALYLFLDNKIYKSAIVLGLAASTKLLAFGSLPIFWILIWLKTKSLKYIIHYSVFMILVVSPWLLRAYLSTGNPVYPFFSPLYTDTRISLDPRNLLKLLTHSSDPINPIYLIILLLLPFTVTTLPKKIKLICIYSILAIMIWVITPNTGGGRFILPYLPALSIVAVATIKNHKFLVLLVILYSLFSISYRFAANLKFLQPKETLLAQKLNFNFGDYYDFDHFFKPSDRVLPIGINNLYYLNAHIAMPNENFDYILHRDNPLPPNYQNWKQVLQNQLTKTSIYQNPIMPPKEVAAP
ncbi:MAG: Dolichyl-phosphate-mannose-protein mannosyltransferase protein [Microgenomates group bacterium Gr01-1014_16]|nr:MAG: Dolichyl-phosphate-mannose-protein mannosyltransferase protein [Microgenomates group bacterium Gr01-1014_16]